MPYWDNTKKKWIAQIRYQNNKYRKLFQTKGEAKKWETNIKQKFSQYHGTQTDTISLYDFAEQYLDYSKSKHAHKTYLEKQAAFRFLIKYLSASKSVSEIHKGEILQHLKEQANIRSGNSANKDRKNLIAAWNWGIKYIKDFPRENPCYVDRFPENRHPRYIPSVEDFWKVYAVAESQQDKIMLLAFLHLAARRSEIFALRWSDINFQTRNIRLFTRKRKDGSLEYDWLPLTDQLREKLCEHEKQRTADWVFPSPGTQLPYYQRQRWMDSLCQKAKVKQFGVHAIRHLSASILMENDVPLIDIKTILRHKNLTTTERYIHRLKSVRSSINILGSVTRAEK